MEVVRCLYVEHGPRVTLVMKSLPGFFSSFTEFFLCMYVDLLAV